MADDPLLSSLLFEEEGPALDFKRDQYPFAGASDTEKAELLKDILAFTNSWRRSDAFILIGVDERPGAKAEVVGITQHFKDADLQQFVNSKTNGTVEFNYAPAELEAKSIGVLTVAVQDRPRYLLKAYGGLPPDTVFVRRGSSTAVAKPDEVARMGAAAIAAEKVPQLKIEFADADRRQITGNYVDLSSTYLDFGEEDLPAYNESDSSPFASMRSVNHEYYRELGWYTVTHNMCTRLQFAITNESSSVAHDVRVELSAPAGRVLMLDDSTWPEVPEKSWDSIMPRHRKILMKGETDISAKLLGDRWIVDIAVEKVQPMSTAWVKGALYIGRSESGVIELQGTAAADNLPKPQPVSLTANVSADRRSIDLKELQRIERQRYLASPAGVRMTEEMERRAREKKGG